MKPKMMILVAMVMYYAVIALYLFGPFSRAVKVAAGVCGGMVAIGLLFLVAVWHLKNKSKNNL